MSGDTDGGTTVSNSGAEIADMAGFVATGETEVVVLTVDSDVFIVPLGKFFDGLLDGLNASRLTHGFGGIIGVATSTVPVTLEGLGVERDLDTPLFGDADEEVASHPEVITHGDTLARPDLEFPLRRHHLGVDTADVDAGVEASAIVGFDEITSEDLPSA